MSQSITTALLRERSGFIKEQLAALSSREVDKEQIRRAADVLYGYGLQLVKSEVRKQPIAFSSEPEGSPGTNMVVNVVTDLTEALLTSSTRIQREYPLWRSLSKAHLIFVELLWWQAEIENIPVHNQTITRIQQTVDKNIIELFPPERAMHIRFTLQSVKEAGKCIPSTAKAVIASDLFNLASDNVALGALKTFVIKVKKACTASWYMSIFIQRWLLSSARTVEEYKQVLDTEKVEKYVGREGVYTVGLADIFMTVIKNPENGRELQALAFFGQASPKFYGLVDLLKYEEKGKEGIVGPLQETRLITNLYLKELIRDPAYADYHTRIRTIWDLREKQLSKRKAEKKETSPLQQEEERRRQKELSAKIVDLKDILASDEPNRAERLEPKKKKTLLEELRTASLELQALQEEDRMIEQELALLGTADTG